MTSAAVNTCVQQASHVKSTGFHGDPPHVLLFKCFQPPLALGWEMTQMSYLFLNIHAIYTEHFEQL